MLSPTAWFAPGLRPARRGSTVRGILTAHRSSIVKRTVGQPPTQSIKDMDAFPSQRLYKNLQRFTTLDQFLVTDGRDRSHPSPDFCDPCRRGTRIVMWPFAWMLGDDKCDPFR